MLEGFLWGALYYLIALLIALWCYSQYSPLYRRVVLVIVFCGVGHYIGGYAYTLMQTDSFMQFFNGATSKFNGMSTNFVKYITGNVREYFTGDSFLATVYFFSAFSFVGSVLWYLLFLQLAQWLKISNQRYIAPAVIIMCWPSFLFFTAGLGKDSLCYFLPPLILLLLNQITFQRKTNVINLFLLLCSVTLMTMIRPYLLMIFIVAYFLSTLKGVAKLTFLHSISIIALIPVVIYVIGWVLDEQMGMNAIDFQQITEVSLKQQESQNFGTSFPILSHNPIIVLLTAPYGFTMNLIMPLIIFARNTIGMLASIENMFLVLLLYRFWKGRKIFSVLKKQLAPVRLCFYFFVSGMFFMSLINTNLGLSMRQKSMYVPAFLVVAMLVWLYKKQHRQLGTPEVVAA